MDSFELNKIMGAILGTCLVLLVTNFAAHAIFAPKAPAKPGFEIAVKEAAAGGGEQARARHTERGKLLPRGTDKNTLNHGPFRAGADELAGGPGPQKEIYGVHHQRLTRPGLAGEHIKARSQRQFQPLD